MFAVMSQNKIWCLRAEMSLLSSMLWSMMFLGDSKSLDRASHMSRPSMSSGLEVAPAAVRRVGSQSWMFIIWWETRGADLSLGLHTSPAPLTPPSHSVSFTPRSGQLEAWFMSKPAAGPPLSVVNTITLNIELVINGKDSIYDP